MTFTDWFVPTRYVGLCVCVCVCVCVCMWVRSCVFMSFKIWDMYTNVILRQIKISSLNHV